MKIAVPDRKSGELKSGTSSTACAMTGYIAFLPEASMSIVKYRVDAKLPKEKQVS